MKQNSAECKKLHLTTLYKNPLRPVIITDAQFTVLKKCKCGLAISIADGKILKKRTHILTVVSVSSAVTDIRAHMIDEAENLSLSTRETSAEDRVGMEFKQYI
ncbi:hypothetical protein RF11_14019 [Thelohanellus kitauei]|uniref:Uncharacterized protein n=1 Tax=Thelohanellus kitauei TaxID=669202 RepID=A0A0C2J0R1_THEKT|nr:hypothetical protein RF11_14019 [Thelohanellus kitauei]